MSVSFKSALLGCTCFTLVSTVGFSAGSAQADPVTLPTGGAFELGGGTIAQTANRLDILQNSSRAVMSWSDFSIGAAGEVHFQNGSGATLNRVTGAHLSQIDGRLSATGSLFLLNPNGVVIGETGRVETGADFVASTLNADDAAFMASGDLALSGASGAAVVNLGQVEASAGDILLAAHEVRNSGRLTAGGDVALMATHEVTYRDLGADRRVQVRAGVSGDVINEGVIEGASARLESVGGNIFALAGNTDGVTRAQIIARNGGRIQLASAETADVAGHLSVNHDGGDGGKITVTGSRVRLRDGATVTARGAKDGGTVHIGGGWQGKDASLRNAQTTQIEQGASINVGGTQGAGGEAVIWADQVTVFEGEISAKGDTVSGGGRVEVSGKQHLLFRGEVDTGGGQLLLDPTDLEIVGTVSGTPAQIVPSGGDFLALQTLAHDTSQIAAADIAALLATNNVAITTQNASGSGAGDLTVNAAIERVSGTGTTVLTLDAERDLTVNARIGSDDLSRPLAVSMSAGRDGVVNAVVETRGGLFDATVGNNFTVGASGAIRTEGGTLSVSTDSDLDAAGFSNGTGMFRVLNGGTLVSGGADIRLASMGIDVAGPSASAIVIDAGTGAVHFNRRGSYANKGFYLSTRGSIGLHAGDYYLWYNDLAKVRAGNLYANSERRAGYLTMYENYGSLDWAPNLSGAAHINGSQYFTVYGGLTGINADVVLDHDGSRASGINSISLGSSPLNTNGNLTIRAPGFRINGSGMYVRSANGNINVQTNEMFNQPKFGLRAPNGYISFEGFNPGAFSAPGDINWYGTPYYGWAASAQAPIVYLGSDVNTTTLSLGTLSAAQTTGISQQLIFRAKDGISFNGSVETDVASISIQPDTDGNGGSAVLAAGQSIRAGGDLVIAGVLSSSGAASFGANGSVEIQSQLTTDGALVLEADRDDNDNGDVKLNALARLRTNGGDAVLSGNRLINLGDASVLDTGTGRYLTYTASPLTDTLGGLTGARRYNRTYAGTPPSGVTETGNLFFYELAPTLSLRADDATRRYGEANPALTYTADISGLVAGDQLQDVVAGLMAETAATSASNVGTYDIQIDLANLTSKMGYTLQTQKGALSVTKAPLNISAQAQSKTYGAADPILTFANGGWVNGDSAALLTGALSRAPGETVAGGPYAIAQGTLDAGGNYAINFTGADFTINPALLTITADAASKTYGAADPTLTFANGGWVNGDSAALLTGALSRAPGENVAGGPYAIGQGTLDAGRNYAITFTGADFTINPALLTVTAAAAERQEGQVNPQFSAFFDGFIAGETPSILSGAIQFDTPAGNDAVSGRYRLTPFGVSSPNYTIAFVDGVLTVLPAARQEADTPAQVLRQNGGSGQQAFDEIAQTPTLASLTFTAPGVGNDDGAGASGGGAQPTGSGAGGGNVDPGAAGATGAGGDGLAVNNQPVQLQYTIFGRTVTIKLPASFAKFMNQAISAGSGLGGA